MRLTTARVLGVLALTERIPHSANSIQELADILTGIDDDLACRDFGGAIALIQSDDGLRTARTFEEVVRGYVRRGAIQPGSTWQRLGPYGIDVILEKLKDDVDTVQCLRDAGLLSDSEDALGFWDEIKIAARAELNAVKSEMGRRGEELSLAYEEREMHRLGIEGKPRWISRRDETHGFDILSARMSSDRKISHYVEAKAHRGSGEFYIPRGEWTMAKQHPRHYVFHVWDLRSEAAPVLLGVSELTPHMPAEPSLSVSWENVRVKLAPDGCLSVELSSVPRHGT